MIAPIGEFVGSNTEGEQIKEILSPEALEKIVFDFHENDKQVMLDRDHASLKKALDRDTQAYGWVKDLKLMSGAADEYNGLYAQIAWTDEGKELVQTKSYRFLSPVFTLDEDSKVAKLVNIALTNRPNFDLPPIFNTISEEDELIEDPNMDIEAFTDKVAEKVVNMLDMKAKEKTVCNEEEKKEETSEETKACNEEKTEKACNETAEEEKKEEEKKEENKEDIEEKKEEKKEEEEEKKEEEVIKPEVLNTIPTEISPAIDSLHQAEEWRSLKGDDLYRWAIRHTAKNMCS